MDDQCIFDEVFFFGGKVVMIFGFYVMGMDCCVEVLCGYDIYVDVVINIQGDELFVDVWQLDVLFDVFLEESIQIVMVVMFNIEEVDLLNLNCIKVVKNFCGEVIYFLRSVILNFVNVCVVLLEVYLYLWYIGLYVYCVDVLEVVSYFELCVLEQMELLEQLCWMYYGYFIRLVEMDIEMLNIDMLEDVWKVLDLL